MPDACRTCPVDRQQGAEHGAGPGGADDRQVPPGRVHAVDQSGQPGSTGRIGATHAVVTDLDRQDVAVELDVRAHPVRARVRRDVGQRLRDDEVRRGLRGRWKARGRHPHLRDESEVGDQRLHSGAQAAVDEDRGQDPAHDPAQLAARPHGLGQRLVDQVDQVDQVDRRASGGERLAGELQRDDRVRQPLLRAVVEVVLHAAAGLVRSGRDPRARRQQGPSCLDARRHRGLDELRIEGSGHSATSPGSGPAQSRSVIHGRASVIVRPTRSASDVRHRPQDTGASGGGRRPSRRESRVR